MAAPRLTVVGSINLDLVARAERLPRPGETVTGATFSRIPGGKGANQAVAAARLGAVVTMIGCVGDDELAAAALAGLQEAGVVLDRLKRTSGSDRRRADHRRRRRRERDRRRARREPRARVPRTSRCPTTTPCSASWRSRSRPSSRSSLDAPREFFLNAAPAHDPERIPPADLTIVNRYELEALPNRNGVIAVTLGAEGAILLEDGVEVARAAPPPVEAVDGTAAGDAFTACLVVSLLEGRARDEALRRACVAGALAASRFGAQTSLPTAEEVDALL